MQLPPSAAPKLIKVLHVRVLLLFRGPVVDVAELGMHAMNRCPAA